MDIIMEKETNDSATKNVDNQQLPEQVPEKKKKKRGLLKMIKVFIFMLRRRSTTSKQTSLWKRIVTAMRLVQQDDQLHLDQDQNPRLFRASLDYIRTTNSINGSSKNNNVNVNMSQLDVPDSPMSPGCKSQYASAVNLQELERGGNCGGGNNNGGSGGEYDTESDMIEIYIDEEGDELIDARAEEFIANFYKQMKLQRLKSDLNNNRIYSIADQV